MIIKVLFTVIFLACLTLLILDIFDTGGTISPRHWWQFPEHYRIQRRLDRMRSGGVLYLRPGVYKVSETIELGPGIALIGN